MTTGRIAIALIAAGLTLACVAAAGDGTRSAARASEASGSAGAWEGYVKPDEKTLKQTLTPLQYTVTQEDGTERPFKNEYWNNKEHGLYVDVVSGEPLFASVHKYDSGTGWPSFWTTVEPENVVERDDRKLFMKRTEVRSRHADSHLGHVFSDGPEPTGLRYCINSAALRFVPVDKLEDEGYGEYVKLFEGSDAKTTGKETGGK